MTIHEIPASGGRRFDALFQTARPGLVGLVRRVVGASEAEDVVQEAFVKLASDAVLERPDHEVTAWLRRVALNLAFNRERDVKRWRARAEWGGQVELGGAQSEERAEDPALHAEREDQRALVRRVLGELKEKQRNCLLLRHSGYSYAEIADTLDLPASSIGTILARAERAFRQHFEQELTR